MKKINVLRAYFFPGIIIHYPVPGFLPVTLQERVILLHRTDRTCQVTGLLVKENSVAISIQHFPVKDSVQCQNGTPVCQGFQHGWVSASILMTMKIYIAIEI